LLSGDVSCIDQLLLWTCFLRLTNGRNNGELASVDVTCHPSVYLHHQHPLDVQLWKFSGVGMMMNASFS
jgi:hypothetical protein